MVCTHKPDKVYADNVYMPIHVGKAISQYNMDIQGDNTGDNISEKNPHYCELTAQYWGWKNLNSEYIGLCHYRRYFEHKFAEKDIDYIFRNIDIILPTPIYYTMTMENKLVRALTLEDEAIFLRVIKKLYPEYEQSVINYLFNNKDIPFNMFVCRKELFDQFAEWQFSILQECEKYISLSNYTRLKRIYGYLAEYLLPIYCFHNKLRIKYEPIVSYIGEKASKTKRSHIIKTNIKYFINNYQKPQTIDSIIISQAVNVGLKNDNINIL